MRVCVILNPWANRGRAGQLVEQIAALIRPHAGVELVSTNAPGHAEVLAADASGSDYDMIVAAGGDGTVNEVVNGLAQGRREMPLAIIPIGSGNDYAYGMGLLADTRTAVDRLFSGRPRKVDLAVIRDEYGRRRIAANAVGIGFDAAVNIESRKITRLHGFSLYLVATMRTLIFRYETPQCQVQIDQNRYAQRMLLMATGIGPRVGGGFLLTPDARPDDGRLDCCLVEPVNRLTLVALVIRSMSGKHVTSPHVRMTRGHSIHLQADKPLPVHLDGEIFARVEDRVQEVRITVEQDGLSLIM